MSGSLLIRDALSQPSCQLVRLSLAGNALGDKGIETITPSIALSKTLTYLDCRSNSVTGDGLLALMDMVCASKWPPKRASNTSVAEEKLMRRVNNGNPVSNGLQVNEEQYYPAQCLSVVDIRCNRIQLRNVTDSEARLRAVGRQLTLKYYAPTWSLPPPSRTVGENGITEHNKAVSMLPAAPQRMLLFFSPQMQSLEVKGEALVLTVDLKHMQTYYSNRNAHWLSGSVIHGEISGVESNSSGIRHTGNNRCYCSTSPVLAQY